MAKRSNRREFLKNAGAAAAAGMAGYWVAASGALGQDKEIKSPDTTAPKLAPPEEKAPAIPDKDKIALAVVGVMGRGGANIEDIQDFVHIVAMCDVDDKNLDKQAEKFPKADRFNDFRKMLESPKQKFDAVLIATADHTHVPASVMAMNLGYHVYSEKPLAHNVWEARLASDTAKKRKRVTQMGTQIHAEPNYRRVVELIQSGAIGPVSEAHCFIDKVWSPAGDPPREERPVPKGLHWDEWLGPAPQQPFRTNTLPANWRKWWDFGNGTLGDMGCHYIDLPFWALGLRHPTRVSAEGPAPDREGTPPWLIVHWDFPDRGPGRPPVKLHWYDAGKLPPQYKEWNLPASWKNGVVFVGTQGRYLFADYSQRRLFPEKKFQGFKAPPKSIPNSKGHHYEWVTACMANDPAKTLCNFDYSGALSEAVLLGTVAYRTGKELEWDAKNLRATNAPEANQYIRREYRKGWDLGATQA
jgi:predicted dehydrogenase